jgi:heat shock protein HslJ
MHFRRSLSLALIAIVLVAACSSASSALTGRTWKWTQFSTAVSQTAVPDPTKYTIEFKSDNTFAAVADCNTVSGTYRATASNALQIIPGPSTQVACPQGSLGNAFVSALASTSSYVIQDNQLRLSSTISNMTFE